MRIYAHSANVTQSRPYLSQAFFKVNQDFLFPGRGGVVDSNFKHDVRIFFQFESGIKKPKGFAMVLRRCLQSPYIDLIMKGNISRPRVESNILSITDLDGTALPTKKYISRNLDVMIFFNGYPMVFLPLLVVVSTFDRLYFRNFLVRAWETHQEAMRCSRGPLKIENILPTSLTRRQLNITSKIYSEKERRPYSLT